MVPSQVLGGVYALGSPIKCWELRYHLGSLVSKPVFQLVLHNLQFSETQLVLMP